MDSIINLNRKDFQLYCMMFVCLLFNDISNLLRLFDAKPILFLKNRSGINILNITHRWEDKGFHTFPRSICHNMVKLDLGVMAMKAFSIHPRSPELESCHHMQFSVIPWTLRT